jgi:hypothetical protein
MKKVTALCFCLALVASALPAQTTASSDLVSLRITDAPLAKALIVLEDEPAPLALESNTESVVSIFARGVPKDRYVRVLERAFRQDGSAEAGGLLGRSELPPVELEELAGFQRLIVDGRNLLAEAILHRQRELGPEQTPTQDYLRHRLSLATAPVTVVGRGGSGFLGVRLAGKTSKELDTLAPEVLNALEGWDGYGAFVADVLPDTGAAVSGLIPGDVVVGINGVWIDSSCTLRKLVSRARLGEEVELDVLRDGLVRKEWVSVTDKP